MEASEKLPLPTSECGSHGLMNRRLESPPCSSGLAAYSRHCVYMRKLLSKNEPSPYMYPVSANAPSAAHRGTNSAQHSSQRAITSAPRGPANAPQPNLGT
eukprot:39458-Prymnesium_polylepis.1